jgi:phage-related protein
MSEFTWIPSLGFTSESSPRINVASFGDGYTQRVADGINNMKQTWSLQFQSNSIATATAIEAFLVLRGGTTSFTWTPPGESTEIRVICEKWTKTYESSISRNISATFERVYT